MTANTLEQRAHELLQRQYDEMRISPMNPSGFTSMYDKAALRAIEAALRLSAGADWALVPREPTEAMCTAHAMYGDTSDWWQAVIAAAPHHEPKEPTP